MFKNKIVTQKQIEYIEQLCIDLMVSERLKRNAMISRIIGRKINYLDELTLPEASVVINNLKLQKEEQKYG